MKAVNKGMCSICGYERVNHVDYHQFFGYHKYIPVKAPKECECNYLEWNDPSNIPPVCDIFNDDGNGHCMNCEHDIECHKKPPGEDVLDENSSET